jgi:thioesterase domain-containing protein
VIVDPNDIINAKNANAGISISGTSGCGSFRGQIVDVTLNGRTYTDEIANDGTWAVSVGAPDVAALSDGKVYTITASINGEGHSTISTTLRVTVVERAASQANARGYVPPRNDDEAKLTQIWEALLGLPRVGVKDDFFEVAGQPLIAAKLAAKLAAEVETVFGTAIDISTLLVAPTIELLAMRLAKSPSDTSTIVPLRASGDRAPLFCFHGGGGHLLEYRDMANLMPNDQPVYGIRPPDLDGAQHLMSVQELAERYLDAIRDVQGSGPYNLCGLSFGGLLAYEVATKFADKGEAIGLLALFDTGNPAYYRNLSFAKSLRFIIDTMVARSEKYIRDLRRGDIAAVAKYVRNFFLRRLESFRWKASRRLSRAAGRPMPKAGRDNLRMFGAVGNLYAPNSFSGRLTLFRAKDGAPEYRHDPALGWEAVALGGVDVLMVQGDHLTMMEKPNVVDLVSQMCGILDRNNDTQKRMFSDLASFRPVDGTFTT